MSSPLVLSDLPIATQSQANDSSAVLLMRVGLTDYQVSVSLIRNINLQALSLLPGAGSLAANTDVLMIGRIVGGQPQNYQIQFSQIGFIAGTAMWFYGATPPVGWSLIPNTGNALLAVSDGVNQYAGAAGGTAWQGTWLQEGVGGGMGALTLAQIPPHLHTLNMGNNSGGPSRGWFETAQNSIGTTIATSDGSDQLKGQTHNHGQTWRPLANVGCLGLKSS